MKNIRAWIERRALWQFAVVTAGINLAAILLVVAIVWALLPSSWLPSPVFVFVLFWTVWMTAWQTWRRWRALRRHPMPEQH